MNSGRKRILRFTSRNRKRPYSYMYVAKRIFASVTVRKTVLDFGTTVQRKTTKERSLKASAEQINRCLVQESINLLSRIIGMLIHSNPVQLTLSVCLKPHLIDFHACRCQIPQRRYIRVSFPYTYNNYRSGHICDCAPLIVIVLQLQS